MRLSVIISTYDSRPYLADALDALAAQTLPADDFEVLVVDDGSSDDTWSYLTELSPRRPNLRIFRQPNSGGASRGRNRGLDEARGRYLFFHDADDYLGTDALRRLVEEAETEGSDVVAGRHVYVGRPTTHRPTDVTVHDADLVEDGVWRSLAPHKLFRRALVDRVGARFPEDQRYGEDQVFVATCLFAASKVSLLGGYDFYHRRIRDDGGNLSGGTQTLTNKRLTSCRMTSLVVANTEPGRRRDALLRRVILSTLAGGLHTLFAAASTEDRVRFLADVRAEVFPHVSERLLQHAPPAVRFRLLVARDGTADQLLALIPVLLRSWRYRVDGGRLCYDLGAELNALLPAEARRVREPLTPPGHRIVALEPSAAGLDVVLQLDLGGLPCDRIELHGRQRGEPWTTLAGADPGQGRVRLTLRPPASEDEQRWALRLVASAEGVRIGHGPLDWPQPDPADAKIVLRSGGRRRVLKLYPGADGHARLVTR